jgi:DNA segregation ATPase FtsK/SpoIIIE-like protein
MVDEDLELEHDLGQATIVYDDPDEDVVKKTVPNEHIAYFQDHWIIKTEEDEQGNDIVRRIPKSRVHYVERSVEEFEEEVQTVRHQVQSVADNLRSKFLGGDDDESSPRSIPVTEEDSDDDA